MCGVCILLIVEHHTLTRKTNVQSEKDNISDSAASAVILFLLTGWWCFQYSPSKQQTTYYYFFMCPYPWSCKRRSTNLLNAKKVSLNCYGPDVCCFMISDTHACTHLQILITQEANCRPARHLWAENDTKGLPQCCLVSNKDIPVSTIVVEAIPQIFPLYIFSAFKNKIIY